MTYRNALHWFRRDLRIKDNIGLYNCQKKSTNISTIFIYDFCLEAGCYNFTIFDSYGDGICCGEGDGYFYGTIYGNREVFFGGNFSDLETMSFCGVDACA